MAARFRKFLLAGVVVLTACAKPEPPKKPEIPASVTPGWTRSDYGDSAAPAGLPASQTPPQCWLARYSGPGTAEVRICGYAAEAGAFDAVQRFPSSAETVKFQAKQYFAVVHWTGASQTDATALVRALQRALPQP